MAKSNYEMATKYFKSDEGKETLGGAFKADSPIEIRSYTYKSGAIYNGEWKGGLRHGEGKMVWLDGARYEGNWEFNLASG